MPMIPPAVSTNVSTTPTMRVPAEWSRRSLPPQGHGFDRSGVVRLPPVPQGRVALTVDRTVQPRRFVETKWSRLLTVAFGGLQIGIGILAADVTQAVISDALAIAGFSAGLLLGLFALGSFSVRTKERSALIGLTSLLAFGLFARRRFRKSS